MMMRLVVGYDRDFTVQFFRRTFAQLARPEITLCEKHYVAERFADTATFGLAPRIGCPWVDDDVAELARASRSGVDRWLHDRAELAANQILVYQGIVSYGGIWKMRQGRSSGLTRTRAERLAMELYEGAARWAYLGSDERTTLRLMAAHVHQWVDTLALVMGNDYLEDLATRSSSPIILTD